MDELIKQVVQWANDRNLIKGSTPEKQLEKTAAELIELTIEVALDRVAIDGDQQGYNIMSELGDVLVTLIIVAEQLGFELEDCLYVAYDKIKDRKGVMRNGKFIKEEDL